MKAQFLIQLILIGLVINTYYVEGIFYLPGMFPKDFIKGEAVPLKVNKITSVHTQIPYKYYSLPVCQPGKIVDDGENLGEILLGDRIENSIYNISFFEEVDCKVLNYYDKDCDPWIDVDDLKVLNDRVKFQYKVHWLLDGLPVVQTGKSPIDTGYDLGVVGWESSGQYQKGKNYIYNHVNIKIHYHENTEAGTYRIVGFEIKPVSTAYDPDSWNRQTDQSMCPEIPEEVQTVTATDKQYILWTYGVTFVKSTVLWNKRWEPYLQSGEKSIHWISILNFLLIVFFLTVMVAMIMMKTLKADFRRYNSMDANEEAEETGWKMIHGDVFRPPQRPMLFSVLVGSGTQVFFMASVTLTFAVLGFLSPANIGGLATSLIVLFVLMAMFAGYFSTRVYLTVKGKNWRKNTLMTAFGFPGAIFGIFFIINMFLRGAKSSAAVPVGTFFAIIAMWFGISVPLVFFGSYFGSKKPIHEDPVRTNQIPRQIPDQVWYMNPYVSILMGGILPFGAAFIEIYFILSALWNDQFYYIFGFFFIVLIILVITSAEISIVMCYFQLCAEDYHWWWRSFLTPGSSALYIFCYTILFFTKLQITKSVSILLYFGYSLIMALGFFVVTGAIGYYSCHKFVRKIYSSIHIN